MQVCLNQDVQLLRYRLPNLGGKIRSLLSKISNIICYCHGNERKINK